MDVVGLDCFGGFSFNLQCFVLNVIWCFDFYAFNFDPFFGLFRQTLVFLGFVMFIWVWDFQVSKLMMIELSPDI